MFIRTLLAAIALTLAAPAAFCDDPKRVRLTTNMGDVVIEMASDSAPASVDNFLRYVIDGFYDGTIFHRTIPKFMVQGGGFSAELQKKPTRDAINNEADNGLKNLRGTIAMARTSAPHSATAQFFINVADNAFLDHTGKSGRGWGYAVFGKVIEGMDVIDRIIALPTTRKRQFADLPTSTVIIERASVDGAQ
jgi:peptidyl-prolyl cis-trans isomerase B (cyclophilin B)